MADLPRFEGMPVPVVAGWPRGERMDHERAPRCPCGDVGPLDVRSKLCRLCWRCCVLAPAFAAARAADLETAA